ncbi:hypothetical protein KST09_06940 [Fusobacterium animalis]|uniref:hypothetical protein n=1 Tax=Fusobacterium animalis TaxID=76859 RepID=UPI0030CE89DE
MNKLISLGVAGLLLAVYKILEYFHLFRIVQVILALAIFVALCYGLSPIFNFFFGGGSSGSSSYKYFNDKEMEYKKKKSELEWQRIAGMSQKEYDKHMKDLNNEYGKSGW